MSSATLRINLTAISENWKQLHQLSKSTVRTAAVVKANAYGLGIKPIAEHLFITGVKTFFVSTADEAVQLRQILPQPVDIYYLNGYSNGDLDAVTEYGIMPVLNSLDQIYNFNAQTSEKKAALQIEVGMNRLGISGADLLKSKLALGSINLNLVMGHLSSADEVTSPQNTVQFKLYSKLSNIFPGVVKSLAATGGILLGKKYHFDLTRPGIGIFGGKPLHRVKNVVRVDLPVLQVKEVNKNEGIGYNHTFITSTPKKIAIVASGYADGLFRQLSNNGALYAEATRCEILGRVSMDLITVDVSALKDVPTTLSVLNDKQTIDDLAKQASTIGYEILTSLGSRYKRVYHY